MRQDSDREAVRERHHAGAMRDADHLVAHRGLVGSSLCAMDAQMPWSRTVLRAQPIVSSHTAHSSHIRDRCVRHKVNDAKSSNARRGLSPTRTGTRSSGAQSSEGSAAAHARHVR